jgi:hypothetical protein
LNAVGATVAAFARRTNSPFRRIDIAGEFSVAGCSLTIKFTARGRAGDGVAIPIPHMVLLCRLF